MAKEKIDLSIESNKLAIEIIEVVTRLAKDSIGECECTVHRRTGDILEVCDSCGAHVDLSEIYAHVEGFKD